MVGEGKWEEYIGGKEEWGVADRKIEKEKRKEGIRDRRIGGMWVEKEKRG